LIVYTKNGYAQCRSYLKPLNIGLNIGTWNDGRKLLKQEYSRKNYSRCVGEYGHHTPLLFHIPASGLNSWSAFFMFILLLYTSLFT